MAQALASFHVEKAFKIAVEPDPFYSEKNMARLRRGIKALENGEGIERELIEVGDEEDMV